MDYFESNMAAMKETRNDLYEKINGYSKESTLENIVLVDSAIALDGDNYLLVQKDSNLHRLSSSYSPKTEANKWAEHYSFNNMNVVISLFGFGSGYFVREIMNRKGTDNVLIIYEPSIDVFIHVLNNYDIKDIILN